MIDLSVYSGRDLQNLKALLRSLHAAEVLDVVEALEIIEEFLSANSQEKTKVMPSRGDGLRLCPDCKTPLHLDKKVESVVYDGCPRCYKVVNVRFE